MDQGEQVLGIKALSRVGSVADEPDSFRFEQGAWVAKLVVLCPGEGEELDVIQFVEPEEQQGQAVRRLQIDRGNPHGPSIVDPLLDLHVEREVDQDERLVEGEHLVAEVGSGSRPYALRPFRPLHPGRQQRR